MAVPREQTQAVPTCHAVQDALQPGRRRLEKPPVTIYINHQRSCMSILDATLHLTSILLILLPSHLPGLEHPEEGSTRLLNTRCIYHSIEGSLKVARSQRTMFLAAPQHHNVNICTWSRLAPYNDCAHTTLQCVNLRIVKYTLDWKKKNIHKEKSS